MEDSVRDDAPRSTRTVSQRLKSNQLISGGRREQSPPSGCGSKFGTLGVQFCSSSIRGQKLRKDKRYRGKLFFSINSLILLKTAIENSEMKLKPAQLNKAAQGDFLMGLPLPDDAEQV